MTSDELVHLPAGCTYLQFKDYHLNPEHPPFVKLLAGAAALTAKPRLETYNWRNADQWRYGDIFYEDNGEDKMLFLGRLPIVGLAWLLGLVIYCCAWEWYGWKAGCLALLLYLLNPELLAHGQLVTTDLGLSCFLFSSVYCFWRALQKLTPGRCLLAGLAIGLTLITKFSGVLIIPILAFVALLHAFSPEPTPVTLFRYKEKLTTPMKKLVAAGGLLITAGILSLSLIWASYGFRYAISPDPVISADLQWAKYWSKPGVIVTTMYYAKLLHLVPEAYSYGFLHVLKNVDKRNSFLLGERSVYGWWYYFPLTFLIKTPLALLVLLCLGTYYLRRYGAGWAMEATLLLPPTFYFAVAMTQNINIGHRHVLPIYSFLIVFAAKMARVFESPREPILRYTVALLLAWHIGATAFIYPHFLSYFNEMAGGPKNGWKWVVDSNIDWGQDLKALGQYYEQHPEKHFYLAYFGSANPAKHGLANVRLLPSFPLKNAPESYAKYTDIPAGAVVAVSVTLLQGMLLDTQIQGFTEFMQKLRGLEPFDRAGYSILLYRIP